MTANLTAKTQYKTLAIREVSIDDKAVFSVHQENLSPLIQNEFFNPTYLLSQISQVETFSFDNAFR